MSTGEWMITKTHERPPISAREEPIIQLVACSHARRPLPGGTAATETSFYGSYSWCLNASPTTREIVFHLSEELDKLETVQEGWQQSEVINNVFLFSCAITDAVDD